MNRKFIATAIAVAMLSSPAFAETDPSRDIDEFWAAQAETQQQMQQHMATMQATMEKIHTEDDAVVRKQLMQEHMQEMRTMMKMMGGMQGGGMMGNHMMGGMQHDSAMPMGKGDTAQCQQMTAMAKHQEHMSQKMGMMHEMMQQMMEREAVHEGEESHEHE